MYCSVVSDFCITPRNAQQSFNFGGYSIYLPSSAQSDANGYGNFEYAPPAGYYALCTKNLARFG